MTVFQREKEYRKNQLDGVMSLVSLGGFIAEMITEEIDNIYPTQIKEAIEKYSTIETGFFDIADQVEDALEEIGEYGPFGVDEQGEYDFDPGEDFQKWLFDEVVKYTTEKVITQTPSFWEKWKLSRETKSLLAHLNALDERVLYLTVGATEKERLSISEVANSAEFSCSEEYINYILRKIDAVLDVNEYSSEEFYRACNGQNCAKNR